VGLNPPKHCEPIAARVIDVKNPESRQRTSGFLGSWFDGELTYEVHGGRVGHPFGERM
jgi:hypothetical protein